MTADPDELTAASRRIAELEAENAGLSARVATLGSTYEVFRQVVVLVRERIARRLREERARG